MRLLSHINLIWNGQAGCNPVLEFQVPLSMLFDFPDVAYSDFFTMPIGDNDNDNERNTP